MHKNNVAPVYLDKNDSLLIVIKNRVITDLKEWISKSSPNSPEGKLMGEKVKTLSQAKQAEMGELFQKSICDYTQETLFNEEAFILFLSGFQEMEDNKMVEKWDIKVQCFGGKYIAEFWADSLSVSSDIAILLKLNKMSNNYSETGQRNVGKVKETNTKHSIDEINNEEYSKVMALLYIKEKEGAINFKDPIQPVFDFINN